MRSLELKTLQIKDDLPLYVTLDSLSTWDKNENRYKFVTRNADSCVYTPVYMLKLYLLLVKKRLLHYWNTFLKYVMLVQVHNVRGRQMTVITLAYCCHIRDTIRLNLILYVIKYWSNFRNCLC